VTAGFGITVTRPRTGHWVVNHGRYDAAGYRTWREASEINARAEHRIEIDDSADGRA
jgi:hypothetical protein